MAEHYISQPELIGAIFLHLDRKGVKSLLPREMNVVVEAANLIVDELRQPERAVRPGMGFVAWWNCDHVGLSSKFMAHKLANAPQAEMHYPRDPDDFWRCFMLLEAVPELRSQLPLMAREGPEWAALVGAWDELETLLKEEYPTGRAPRMFKRMQELEVKRDA